MAVSEQHGSKDLLLKAVSELAGQGIGLPESRWLFLGNQRLRPDKGDPSKAGAGLGKMESVRNWLGWWGADVVMIDTNGKDGAIIHDLSKPFGGFGAPHRFDVVANFGTTEHVAAGQLEAFRTMHNLCKPGGLMLHSVPAAGGCDGHGVWKYSLDWFEQLAERNGYSIRRLCVCSVEHNRGKGPHFYANVVLARDSTVAFNAADWIDPVKG